MTTAMVSAPAVPDLKTATLQALRNGVAPVAAALNMPNVQMLDEGSLGDFPWYWQNGTNFNAKTFAWLNNVFAYNAQDDFIGTNAENFLTQYFAVLGDISYALSDADRNALNTANLANAAVVNTLITDWTSTQGPFPSTVPSTQIGQLNYIATQVLSWGTAGLTLGALRTSLNPMSLLPNVPLGGDQVVSDLMTYLGNTSSVQNLQEAMSAANALISATRLNVAPAPAQVKTGWMTIVNDAGVTQWTVQESTAQIQNNLLPPAGQGKSVNATLTASKTSSDLVHITAEGGIEGAGSILDLITIAGEASASYDLFSFDESVTTVDVTLTYNGVTTFTPTPVSFDVSSGAGWWNPAPIKAAAAWASGQTGYQFQPDPGLDFGVNGTFGTLARVLIAQQPVMTLTFDTSNYSAFTQKIAEQSRWGVSFLGIPLAGGSQSYYSAQTRQDESGDSVTVTMTPVGVTSPVTAVDQLACVLGVEMLWPGAS